MSTKTYQALEGELTVRPSPTVSRSGGSNAVAIVGGYDADNASSDVTAGEATRITDPVSAEDTFGDSEIARNAAVVSANGVSDLWGIPVAETETTESFSGSQSLTLPNNPVFDPELHPDHDVTVTDTANATDLTVKVVHGETTPTPSEEDTANLNPDLGEIETDSSSDYDVTYTYGDYQSAIETAGDLGVRYLNVLTENAGIKATVSTVLADIANDFDFKRAVVGATPEIEASDIGDYSPDESSWRIVEVAPSRATGADGPVRTQSAIAGMLASQPLGPDGSILFDNISGISGLRTSYRASTAKSFDSVTSITRSGTVAQAVTTSTSNQFKNIYATEIVDEVALRLFSVARDYAGGPQDIGDLQTLLRGVCVTASSGSPPLLGFAEDVEADPFDINVGLGATDGVADADISIVPSPIAEQVNIGLTVTDGFVEFDGAE